MLRRVAVLACALALVSPAAVVRPAHAGTLETRDAAFARLFPAASHIDRRTVFLSEAQVDSVQGQADARLDHPRVTYYVVSHQDSVLARAYLDTHAVRSHNETLLFVLAPTGAVERIDVLAFHEPEDYLPTRRWYERLAAVAEPCRAQRGQDVDAISGATLSVRAAATALRRVCAIDQQLHPRTATETP